MNNSSMSSFPVTTFVQSSQKVPDQELPNLQYYPEPITLFKYIFWFYAVLTTNFSRLNLATYKNIFKP